MWTAVILVAVGLGWGLTVSLTTVATWSTLSPIQVTYWGTIVGLVLITALNLARGRRLPLDRPHIAFYAVTGLIGTALPHALSFYAAAELPAGPRALIFALIPTVTLLISIPLGLEQASLRRAIGIALGFLAIVLLAVPGGDMALTPWQLVWIGLSLVVAVSYSLENVYIALRRPPELDPLTALWGMTAAALIMLTPVLPAMGFSLAPPPRFAIAEAALIGTAVIHIGCYGGLIWLIARAGSVFAAQVSYIVTPAGVLWGSVILDEPIGWTIALSLGLILLGLSLIKPRNQPNS